MRRSLGLWLLLVGACLGQPSLLLAANCGGSVACKCGDTVTSDYQMTGDLGPCPGHGLTVRSNVTLDCQGFGLVGLGNGSEQYGVYLRGDTGAEVTGATVRRCELTRFYHGLRLRAAADNTVAENLIHGNGSFSSHAGYGIDVAVGSSSNLFQANVISGNADEGIHFGSGTGGNRFIGNQVFDNYREQIYLLQSDGNVFAGNSSFGTGTNSLYLKDSKGNAFEGNTFRDRTARVTGYASGNVFVDNTFVGATFQFRVYDASPARIPTNNVVRGGSLTHDGTCLRFTSTWGNVVSDVDVTACGTQVLSESSVSQPSANTLVSMPLVPSKVSIDASSTLLIGWWLDVSVEDAARTPLPGARVQVTDLTGALAVDLVTGADGTLPPQVLIQSVRTGPVTVTMTPHTLSTTAPWLAIDTRTVQATQDLDVAVVLSSGGPADPPGPPDPPDPPAPPDPPDPPPGGSGTFADDFNRLGSSTVGNGWVEVLGDLVLSGGELRNAPLKGGHIAVLPALDGADQGAAADFATVDNNPGPRFGVVLRYLDALNYYVLYRRAGGTSGLRIAKVVGGKETILASARVGNPALNRPFRLEGRAEGNTLTLELDGVVKASVSDATFATGSPGLYLGTGASSIRTYRADNFSAVVYP